MKNTKLNMMGLLKNFCMRFVSMLRTYFSKQHQDLTLLENTSHLLPSKKLEEVETLIMTTKKHTPIEEVNSVSDFKHKAYSVVQLKTGKYAVVELSFNADDNQVENSIKIIESNSDIS